jgi:hypothetical protein
MNNALRLQVVPCLGGLYKLFGAVLTELPLFSAHYSVLVTPTKAKCSRSSSPEGETPVRIGLVSLE